MGRKRKPFRRESTYWSKLPLYVVATEGAETEKLYFNTLFRKKNIRMPILSTSSGNSSPQHVMRRLMKYRKNYNADPNEMWLVVDRDDWDINTLASIAAECGRMSFNFIISNPCFELWLLLHSDSPKTPLTGRECINELKKLIPGYQKSKFTIKPIENNIEKAINNARNLDVSDRELPPAPTTRVYKLVEKLSLEN